MKKIFIEDIIKNNSIEDIIKKVLFIFTILCLILFVAYNQTMPNRVAQDLEKVAASYGLRNVTVSINGKDSEFDIYYAHVACSNLDSLSYSSMLNLDKALHRTASDEDYPAVITYSSNDNGYRIDSSYEIIEKNGEEIYNNYYNTSKYLNSDEYKKKLEEEEAAINRPFTGSYNSHGSSSKKDNDYGSSNSYGSSSRKDDDYGSSNSYGSSSKKDDDYDPYHAKDYAYEEDFYDDYYDEFYDYEDAVDYYYDHQ